MKNNYIFIINELKTERSGRTFPVTKEETEKQLYLRFSEFWDEKIRQWLINSNDKQKTEIN